MSKNIKKIYYYGKPFETNVSVTQIVPDGIELAQITVDDVTTSIFQPYTLVYATLTDMFADYNANKIPKYANIIVLDNTR